MKRWLTLLMTLLACGAALAQESTSFKIKSAVFNGGGRPLDGVAPSSAMFLIRPDAIGEGVVTHSSASGSFRLNAGFVQAFPPPGEVQNLTFTDATTMAWDLEPLAMHYHLYRAGPMGTGMGMTPVTNCLQPDVTSPTTTETAVPPPDQAYFYSVNGVNCTSIEGPRGTNGTRCP